MLVIDHDYDVLGEEDDFDSIDASQVNDTDFKAISHKEALAALRASDKVTMQTQRVQTFWVPSVSVLC